MIKTSYTKFKKYFSLIYGYFDRLYEKGNKFVFIFYRGEIRCFLRYRSENDLNNNYLTNIYE